MITRQAECSSGLPIGCLWRSLRTTPNRWWGRDWIDNSLQYKIPVTIKRRLERTWTGCGRSLPNSNQGIDRSDNPLIEYAMIMKTVLSWHCQCASPIASKALRTSYCQRGIVSTVCFKLAKLLLCIFWQHSQTIRNNLSEATVNLIVNRFYKIDSNPLSSVYL